MSPAEVCRQQQHTGFAASLCGDSWAFAWVHKRGALDKSSADGGFDLIVLLHGGFPQVVVSGARSLSAPCFDGSRFAVAKDGTELVVGSVASLQVSTWLTMPAGETLQGSPTWAGADLLFVTSGGTPKRSRLYAIAAPLLTPESSAVVGHAASRQTIFTAEHGGSVASWDRSPTAPHAVLVVHRLANAMLAEIVLVQPGAEGQVASAPRVLARDGRVEYCRPQAAFLADGRVVARLNLATGDAEARDMVHGLWLLDLSKHASSTGERPTWERLHVCAHLGDFGQYDVCSTSYAGAHGVREGFVLDSTRTSLAFTARSHDPACGMADELFLLPALGDGLEPTRASAAVQPCSALASGKGCHVPVALAGKTLVYHCRSPVEAGDLWMYHGGAAGAAVRITHTFPPAIRTKLSAPQELVIGGRHALLYRPPPSSTPQDQPAIIWAHGGPMAAFSYDYNPIASWLASLGYFVCVPNFAGSVGFGISLMDEVFGDGCGVADLKDCVACAEFMRTFDGVDARRGVAIAGHSWGGYLALRALTAPSAHGTFSCGVACAGIADWFCQQRHTEVRYYDYALMGGWVYDPEVRARAKEASPHTHAAMLEVPLLVLHGEDDIDVPFVQARAFVEAARAARSSNDVAVPALEFESFEGEGHGMGGWRPATQALALQRVKDFLRVHLKPWDFTDNPHGELTAY